MPTSSPPPPRPPIEGAPSGAAALAREETTVKAADGTRLHVERFAAAVGAPRGALVMIHGFAMHTGLYRHVAAAFARAGLDVTSFDCRGHGRSDGRRAYVRRFSDYRDDLDLVVGAVRARHPTLPLAVAGHSHGATIALDYALAARAPLAALVLAAPWLGLKMKVPAAKRALAPILGRLWPTLALGNGIRAEDIARDPAAQDRIARDPLIPHVATSRWFNEARATQTYILAHATTLKVPTFMAIPGVDRIADAETSLGFARAAGPVIETRIYPGAFHEIFLEPNVNEIIAEIVSWLVPRLDARILHLS